MERELKFINVGRVIVASIVGFSLVMAIVIGISM